MRALVTGAAGFIGSHLVDRLLAEGHQVVGYDNLSTGQRIFLDNALNNPHFQLIEADLLEESSLTDAMEGVDFVWHLAANADVRFGTDHPRRDLEQNTVVTSNVLEAMRCHEVRNIAFSSTGSIYGEAEVIPTPEDCPMPVQTSFYGASKLACEGMISAYCEGFGMRGWIFRFVSILGERYTHGHIFDFYRKLLIDPSTLHILGNGRQRKSYLYIHDCLDAMFRAVDRSPDAVTVLNLGTDEYVEVNDSVDVITEHLHMTPTRTYAGGERGWIGDNPFIFLDCRRMQDLGWQPRQTIRDGILKTLTWLQQNQWVLEGRR
ncbi:MAG TPA: nucleoside-diphosphate sugar epimerase [Gammaproteobacteria bacterium]|jgi:UDP-glucose 4-epimerase|nr:nucleoside-diphosphate sugar epimerase [Acidiferrobacteraceae bacterium]MDP6397423.1 NAD-dependent epimerase/dehydratase family protein [Arenicellales bacterium]HCX88537.1 nucleoside-diphosphate sugar epimerase [Gammaproteobacteria bacterium]MDP6551705.1 NAD-dependent epimerase/dehydratase family protein [Arenicellales bacterium]MDP6791505.1 NAD-dependent epimerase/dehydratase family protein [Arenicellales bacterium]|tara:strand:+ start:2409 stop:3365 length:957 start_codon:yes stop_codon:yes gene_type:complete